MTANEMTEKIKRNPMFKGLDITVQERWNEVQVYGFNMTPDWKATKAELEAMGFKCGPNFGNWEGEYTPPAPTLYQGTREEFEAECRSR